jgi:prepilin-type N-terminal cleavage/methylation domain-containing protein/prepilin-type processing-associated H-X9-DG protein
MARTSKRPGFTVIELLVVIGIIAALLALIFPAIQRIRATADQLRCANNMRQIGIALHLYHGDRRALPPGCSYKNGTDPYPHMAWCTRILPYLEQDAAWQTADREFRRVSFFLGPPVHTSLAKEMTIFVCPTDGRRSGDAGGFVVGFTHYLGVGGLNQNTRDGVLFLDSNVRLTDIRDGASNTLMVGERPPSAKNDLGWWYAGWGQNKNGSGDSVLGVRELCNYINAQGCPPGPYSFRRGDLQNQCDAFHFWSLHPGGANFLFADATVRFLSYAADAVLPALATRNGGEPVSLADIE